MSIISSIDVHILLAKLLISYKLDAVFSYEITAEYDGNEATTEY